jgi:hypothetical protein
MSVLPVRLSNESINGLVERYGMSITIYELALRQGAAAGNLLKCYQLMGWAVIARAVSISRAI